MKLENIMMDEHGNVRICDLGLAVEIPSGKVRPPQLLDTLRLTAIIGFSRTHSSGFLIGCKG